MKESLQFDTPDRLPYQRVQGPTIPLTDRQKEILIFSGRGFTNAQTANELGIALQTVKNHLYAVNRKLLETNATGAITRALNSGELSLEDF